MKQSSPQKYRVKSVNATLKAMEQLSHATVQEIYECVNLQPAAQKTSLTTVYRAINTLVEDGVVKPLNFNDGQVRYELNHPHTHHHHFVCLSCNTIEVIDACPIEQVVEQFRANYQVHYHHFELFGLCIPCQQHPASLTVKNHLNSTPS